LVVVVLVVEKYILVAVVVLADIELVLLQSEHILSQQLFRLVPVE
jgi:hypothetical protein